MAWDARTLPPDLLMRSGGHVERCEFAISTAIPLASETRMQSGERSRLGYAVARTKWAAADATSRRTRVYGRSPLMVRACRTFPPHADFGRPYDLVRTQRPVQLRVPLCCDVGVARRETVGDRSAPVRAERTAGPTNTIGNIRSPLVIGPCTTLPPDLAMRPSRYLIW